MILVNSNPATIMTDPEMADVTYIEPITWQMVARIIEKERPDALLPTMGGQTALNCALDLAREGVLEKYGVEMIGAKQEAIDKAEDREQFKNAMAKIGLESPAQRARALPRGGAAGAGDGGLPHHHPALLHARRHRRRHRLQHGGVRDHLRARPRRLAHQGAPHRGVGARLEGIRDGGHARHAATTASSSARSRTSIPMGVHTGDSITVAPAQTLTDKEYQIMRDASIACMREIGVETGGSNIQFAINPDDGRMIVIEMNPRVSRSSALASKATGFPIAKIAAKLAVGYTLDELRNDITGRRHAGLLRADHRLRGDEGAALRLREVPAGRRPPHHADEERGRGDGHRAHLPGVAAEGAARPGSRRGRLQPEVRRHGEDRGRARLPARRAPLVRGRRVRRRHVARGHPPLHEDRPLVPGADQGPGRHRARDREEDARRFLRRRSCYAAQAQGLLRPAPRAPLEDHRARGAQAPPRARASAPSSSASTPAPPSSRPSTAYIYSTYDEEDETRAHRPPQDHDPRRRAQPHRPGHRVRLLLRARGARAARGRLRDHHGQLQPGDRLHRLRHLRPALLRAAHARGRARDRRHARSPRA